MTALELTKRLVRSCLQLGTDYPLSDDTVLLGGFPEFNSLTITTLITQIEDATGCEISDQEISGEIFETLQSLADFIEVKISEA
ncbi:MAG: acyl carrier protein [Haliea sp.]|uniref:acyl carrier protein n=1 Tax=Haliea sp. TaxID=1932666 RepID=UPI000C5BACD1|nr:phosphopantetheine-binding protein [Haliea sp.]MBM70785.1 acyl carrier protein [Haliea sp.]